MTSGNKKRRSTRNIRKHLKKPQQPSTDPRYAGAKFHTRSPDPSRLPPPPQQWIKELSGATTTEI